MDFKQLRSFVAVADCGSFTQAAAQLYTSQPTVSAHIRQLEEELHETLFLRTTKSLAITARGQELYDYAVHVLELQDQLLDAWAQDEHTIRLGASHTFCPRFCRRSARSIRTRYFPFCSRTVQVFCSSFAQGALSWALRARRSSRRSWFSCPFSATGWC